jgi:hypothetical protein
MSKENTKSGCALFAALGLIGGGFSSAIKSGSKTTGKAITPVPAVKPFTRRTNDVFQNLPDLFINRNENKDRNRR